MCTFHSDPAPDQMTALSVVPLAAAAAPVTKLAWTTVGTVPDNREEGASASYGTKQFLFGGFFNDDFDATTRVDVYDVSTKKWSRAADMLYPVTHAALVQTATRAFLFGGYVGTDPGPSTAVVQIYNFKTGKWTRGGNMPAPRGAHAAVLVDNIVYMFGGRNKARTAEFQETWAYNLDTNKYKVISRMPDPRNHLTGAAVDGQVYAIGGQKNEASRSVNMNVTWRYNPNKDRWFSAAKIPDPISHQTAATFVYDKKIITVGGETKHNFASKDVRFYDPYTDTWNMMSPLPGVRRAGFGALINNRIYFAGGSVVGASQDELFRSGDLSNVLK